MRVLLAAPLLLLSVGCLTPRSVALGNTAAALGPGQHEVSVTGGLSWQTQTAAPQVTEANNNTITSYATAAGVQFPAAEANAQFGLTKIFGLNLHLSPAGIQPGLKMTLLQRPVTIGILPELGVGFGSFGNGQTVFVNDQKTEADPTYQSFFGFNAGARVLFFHQGSGAYGGLGYQFQSFSVKSSTGQGTTAVIQSSTDTLHNVLAAIGYELKTGSLRIRPELAIAITPERSTSVSTNNAAAISRSGGNAFFFFPNVTFAIAGAPGASRDGEEETDAEEERERRREDGETSDADDEDLDENARVKKKKKKKAPPPEEETVPTRRKTSKVEAEEEAEKKKAKEEEEGKKDDPSEELDSSSD